ncbi:MAG: carboxypeptidase regulatory-like domain-containing protein [Vicinamibacterales bacterium]
MKRRTVRALVIAALAVAAHSTTFTTRAHAQVATTAGVTGIVKDTQGGAVPGATVTATHVPSGTTYTAVTQEDGRFLIPAMRVGGPYAVTVELAGFAVATQHDLALTLGVIADLSFVLEPAGVSEHVDVVAAPDPIFSSSRTGASTAVTREELAALPTITGRINDMTRMTPQAGSNGSFAGQDNRLNNITVDGAYFNNSFGLGGQPGDRTNVAPVSLEAIEQVQVSIAPYDVRQGNFVGAGVNMVTRSGTNRFVGSVYTRYRNESFVGTEAAGQTFNPGTFKTTNTGVWIGGPILRNRLFAFGSYERQNDTRPLVTFRANQGGEAVGGSVTRVLASDLTALSAFLKSNFDYEAGGFDGVQKKTPAKPLLMKFDYNLNRANKITFRYSQLNSSTNVLVSGSSSAGFGRGANSANWLGFEGSNYTILENFKSGVTELHSTIGSAMSNSLTLGYTTNDESRGAVPEFPFVDIRDGSGVAYTSFGPDPFTRNNELRYRTLQAQDSFTKFARRHTFTFGGSVENYNSDNVFFSRSNSVYVYNSLADFYTDANDYLANPGRTTSPVTLARFQVAYMNLPGLNKPLQPLEAWYMGAYAQDQWQLRPNVSLSGGLRVDTPRFKNTAYDNPNVNALTFRDENGQPVQYITGKMPDAKPLWSPRLGLNWDVRGDQTTQVRGGTGIFTGKPAYVWISNQIGNTGMLTGLIEDNNTTSRPFNPDPAAYVPANVTGAPAASLELNVTDPSFKFPQVWRSNAAVDRQLPWGLIATGELVYTRDVNGIYYINANLPAPQSTFTGPDNRPRWVGASCTPADAAGCVNRINNAPGNQVTAAYVLKNQNVGRSWNIAGSLTKRLQSGFSGKLAYSYGETRNTVDPGSTASGTFTGNAHSGNPNDPGLGYSVNSPGHRFFVAGSYTKQYFGFGATTIGAFWEARTNLVNFATNASYVYAGDMNGDGAANNDLIYVPRDASEMNFATFTSGGRTFTADEQAAAFEAYIQQDPYLSTRRGQYAERNALFLPLVKRMDFSVTQELFHSVAGRRHAGQIRLDITNFGNLLNSRWGVGQRPAIPSASSSLNLIPILTSPTVAADGTLSYRMALVNNQLPTETWQTTTFLGQSGTAGHDVYTIMLSFRYSFQ